MTASTHDGIAHSQQVIAEIFGDHTGEPLQRLERQVHGLRTLVFDLLTEVEALRAHHLKASAAEVATYRQTYEHTALQSHNSAGPFGGAHRLLWAWYGQGPVPPMGFPSMMEAVRREVSMLRRLGASEAEISDHLRRVEEHATRT